MGGHVLGQAPREVVAELRLPEFKKGLDSAVRHMCDSWSGPVQGLKLDLVNLVGPFQVRICDGIWVPLQNTAGNLFKITQWLEILEVM